ncbi:MAG: N-acetylglucosamine-6-phosphate deacetylase [Coprococcus sp.]
MKTLIKNGMVYVDHHFEKTDILINDKSIAAIGAEAADLEEKSEIYDAGGCYVTPGFIDVHTHGAFGVDVNAASQKDYETIGHFFATEGTTSWQCSILTDTKEQTEWCIDEAVRHHLSSDGDSHGNYADLLGIHLEGPFLASRYKGAMPEYLLRAADMELLKHYQDRADGFVRYITVSPEVAGIPEHVRDMNAMGIRVAIGHSGADYETAWKCIREGAAAATHIFNAMRLFHQHEPAIMGAVLESDIYCEAICDGRHLHPGSVRFLLKVKGYDRVIAITDSIMAAGLPDGEYKLGVNDVVVEDGDAKLKDGTRAGSTLTTGQAFRNLIRFTGEAPEKILPLLTENPAAMLGVQDRIGSLAPGKDADILIMDKEYRIIDTFVKGRKIDKERRF